MMRYLIQSQPSVALTMALARTVVGRVGRSGGITALFDVLLKMHGHHRHTGHLKNGLDHITVYVDANKRETPRGSSPVELEPPPLEVQIATALADLVDRDIVRIVYFHVRKRGAYVSFVERERRATSSCVCNASGPPPTVADHRLPLRHPTRPSRPQYPEQRTALLRHISDCNCRDCRFETQQAMETHCLWRYKHLAKWVLHDDIDECVGNPAHCCTVQHSVLKNYWNASQTSAPPTHFSRV